MSRARSAIVPNFAMMSEAVITRSYDNRRTHQAYYDLSRGRETVGQRRNVLDTDELLARLEARGIRNVDIAKVLGLPDSRVPEIKRKERR
jgi:hypothetical protein